MNYDYNPAQQQARFDPDVHAKRMAMAQQDIRAALTGTISGAGAIGRETLVSRGAGLEYQMERLAKIIATNEEMFNQLSTRLTPFVRSLPIQEQEKRTQETGAQSPLADQVSRLADQLDRINRGMTFLIDGVDL